MSTPFLMGFTQTLIPRLIDEGLVAVAPSNVERVEVYLANYLGQVARGGSLLSSVDAALLACPEVEEVFFDLMAGYGHPDARLLTYGGLEGYRLWQGRRELPLAGRH